MPDAVTHPSAHDLAAFRLGKLPAGAAAAVAAHLNVCPDCRRAAGPPALPPELADHSRYRILRELGRGGMGVVYQARQTMMDREVVIKVISKSLLEQPGSLERFEHEVRAAAKLSHPNIVTAYDAEQAGDLHMLVMEFVPGQNLAELVAKKGLLPVAQACHYARQVALGLQHAFERGMVHRDIKPANLIVTPKGQVKILDFGLAKIVKENQHTRTALTALNSYMGTPDYSAPEQATDARKADIRADLYSLGCTLYFLLASQPPFQEETAVKTILAHLEKEPPPLPELRTDVSAALWAVIARLLAKDPARRYQQPAEVAQALVPFIKSGGQGSTARGVPRPPALASPGTGTVAGGDTRRLKDVAGKAPPAAAGPQRDRSASPPADLEDALPVAEPVRKARPAAEPVPAGWDPRWLMLAGGAAVLLLVFVGLSVTLVGLWAGGVFKGKTKDSVAVIGKGADIAGSEDKASPAPQQQAPPASAPADARSQEKTDAGPLPEDVPPAQAAVAPPTEGKPAPEDSGNDNRGRHFVKIGDTWFEREQPKEATAPAPAKPPSAGAKKPPADGNKPDKPAPGRMDKPDPKVAADPKSKPEPTPEDGAAAERKASLQLRQVKEDLFGGQQVDRLRLNSAKEDLQEIIKKYPKTEAAGEAKKLLDRLNGDGP